MGFALTSKDYLAYMKLAADKIAANKEYVSDLDAATGDGDHWFNMDMGFSKVMEKAPELEALAPAVLFKQIGMIMMCTIGGSAGALYGSGYISAAKALGGAALIDQPALAAALEAMLKGICERGNSKPGMKTLIDTIGPAVHAYQSAIERGEGEKEALLLLKAAARQGMESTRDMEAVRGRAYYQAGKGVGHLDPGAVTMLFQLETLADFILSM